MNPDHVLKWQVQLGRFIANVGNWIAGHPWGVDLFWSGVEQAVAYPDDAAEMIATSKPTGEDQT